MLELTECRPQQNPSTASHFEAKKASLPLSIKPGKRDEHARRLVVATGLVGWSSFSLHLLDLSDTCYCSGYNVPDGTTDLYSNLCSRLAQSNTLLVC